MVIGSNNVCAVLTGDIVESTKLSSEDRQHLRQVLYSASEKISKYFHEFVPYKLDVFRRDSWQFVVSDPSKSLCIGLFFRALIREGIVSKRVDTRISIGLGTVSFIPANDISSGDGEAFQLSGETLEQFTRATRLKITFPRRFQSPTTDAIDVIVDLIDLQVRKWTMKQAKATSGAILEFTQEEIATEWFDQEISQQAIAQHLDRAGWSTIEQGIRYFERSIPVVIHSE
ncbi:MAG: hypothetical protein IMY80_05230 [Chloroflexi bacterium]|nr:hypothetical protein [Chloroflexota bacterium]